MSSPPAEQSEQLLKRFSFKRLLLPLSIAIAATAFIIYYQFDINSLKGIEWSAPMFAWIALGIIIFIISNLFLFYRYRLYTDYELSWRQASMVGLMLMFAHSVFPPLIAATGIQYLLIKKEGISTGKSISVFFMVSFSDHVFFILGIPIILLFLMDHSTWVIDLGLGAGALQYGVMSTLTVGYIIVSISLLTYSLGLFMPPSWIKKTFNTLFSTRLLQRWKDKAQNTVDELIIANQNIKNYGFSFWVKNAFSTLITWSLRFAVVNCIIAAFSHTTDHLVVFAKQFPIFILMMNIPTPGGAGTAEIMFTEMLSVHVADGLSSILALLWRGITYYPYLIIGLFLLPIWIKEKYGS